MKEHRVSLRLEGEDKCKLQTNLWQGFGSSPVTDHPCEIRHITKLCEPQSFHLCYGFDEF